MLIAMQNLQDPSDAILSGFIYYGVLSRRKAKTLMWLRKPLFL